MLNVIAKVVAKPEKVEETEMLMKSIVPITQKEEGCISYEIFQEKDKANTYFFLETWESKDALDRHLSNDHMVHFISTVDDLLSEPIEVRLLTPVSIA